MKKLNPRLKARRSHSKEKFPGLKVVVNILNYILMITAVVAIMMLIDQRADASEVIVLDEQQMSTVAMGQPIRICVPADREPVVMNGTEYTPVVPECKERNVWVKIKKIFLYIGKIGLTLAAIVRGPAIVDSVAEMWEYSPYE